MKLMGHGETAALCVAGALAISLASGTTARAQATAAQPAVCVFKSESYSEGAMVCSGRLVLGCITEANRTIWRAVRDQDTAGVCHGRGRITQRARLKEPQRPAASTASGKCFSFNGNQYCE